MNITARPGLLLSSAFWLAATIFGAYLLFNLKEYVNFGIDLVGGTYLTLDVKTEEAVKNELLLDIERFNEQLKSKKEALPAAPKIDELKGTAILEFENKDAAKSAYNLFKDYQRSYESLSASLDGNVINLAFSDAHLNDLRKKTVEDDISIIRTRLDVFGAGTVPIFPQGERNIVVELPHVSDPEKAKERIGKAALLELKPVYDYALSEEELLEKIGGTVPEGSMIVEGQRGSKEEGFYLIPEFSKVTGRMLKKVSYDYKPTDFLQGDQRSPHTVAFQLDAEGSKKFYELTKDHKGDRLAIVIDNVVISAPNVNEAISGGSAYISGDFDEDSAKDLVAMLKSGAFAAPVEFIEERHIGPSLGQESIRKGLMSCSIGLALLLIFSLFVYKIAGFFAFVVLLYNLLFILFGLALIPDSTLTLPGIAGMVLTLGMAIDSSILIYERIKEELSQGVSLRNAINSGFSGATTVILDANITTFIVGAVLYYFGSPAIQGFALTMMVGIVSTLITGLLLLKWFFNFSFDILGIRKISF